MYYGFSLSHGIVSEWSVAYKTLWNRSGGLILSRFVNRFRKFILEELVFLDGLCGMELAMVKLKTSIPDT